MKEKINVLCATDNNFAPYCGVMLTSVFENTPNADAFVFISDCISEDNKRKFHQMESKYGSIINFVEVDRSIFNQLPMGFGSWPVETYYRFAAQNLLPNDIQKVIYLDCDMIVNCDLHELWDIPIDDHSILVVPDINYDSNLYKRLGYPSKKGYFNAGMMVINLKYWRDHDIQQQLFEFVLNNKDLVLYPDQDGLNVVLKDTKKTLPMKYNFMPASYSLRYYGTFPEEVKEKVLNINPKIIHYTSGLPRPWQAQSYGMPFRSLWWKYAKKSPWKHRRETYSQHKRINWWIKRHFFMPLGFYIQNRNIIPQARNINC